MTFAPMGSPSVLFILATLIACEVGSDIISDCAGKPADVIFVLDASNSIWKPDFQRQLNFVKDLVDFFTIGENNIMVGAISFADYAQPQFHLNYYYRKSDIKDAIDNIRQDGGYMTRTFDGLRYLRERCFLSSSGARRGVSRIGIVITDGRSENTTLTAAEAAKIKLQGIHLFAVGVGHFLDMDELRSIASDPADYYTFRVENYEGLERIKDLLAIKTCTVTDLPSTTRTSQTTLRNTPKSIRATPTTTRRATPSMSVNARSTYPSPLTPASSAEVAFKATPNAASTAKVSTLQDVEKTSQEEVKAFELGLSTESFLRPRLTESRERVSELDRDVQVSGWTSPSNLIQKNTNAADNSRPKVDKDNDGDDDDDDDDADDDDGQSKSRIFDERGDGRDFDELSEHTRRKPEPTKTTLWGIIAGEENGRAVSRQTIRFEGNRSPDILEPPVYVPDSPEEAKYHELRAKNHTSLYDPTIGKENVNLKEPKRDSLENDRRKRTTKDSGLDERVTDSNYVIKVSTDAPSVGIGYTKSNHMRINNVYGIWTFDIDGRLIRDKDSETLVDLGELPPIPDDSDIFIEGDKVWILEKNGMRRMIGCIINGTHFIGHWIFDENGIQKWFGYPSPDITDRIRNEPISSIESSEHRVDDRVRDENGPEELRQRNANGSDGDSRHELEENKETNPSGGNVEVDQKVPSDGTEIVGYWGKDNEGRDVYYLYVSPGVFELIYPPEVDPGEADESHVSEPPTEKTFFPDQIEQEKLENEEREKEEQEKTEKETRKQENKANLDHLHQEKPGFGSRPDGRNEDPNSVGSNKKENTGDDVSALNEDVNIDQTVVLDPFGKSGYWVTNEHGRRVWFRYTCPGVYEEVPVEPSLPSHYVDGTKVGETGNPECTRTDENGQDVRYRYVGPGEFREITHDDSNQNHFSHRPDEDDAGYHAVGGKPEISVTNPGWGESGSIDNQNPPPGDQNENWESEHDEKNKELRNENLESKHDKENKTPETGFWKFDPEGNLRRVKGAVQAVNLPEIDDGELFVDGDEIWFLDKKNEKSKLVGCIINGTHYIGFWIKGEDGSRFWYGYPTSNLTDYTQQEQRHRIHIDPSDHLSRDRDPDRAGVDERGEEEEGFWDLDENGNYVWYRRVGPFEDEPENQELMIGLSDGDQEQEASVTARFSGSVTSSPGHETKRGVVLDQFGKTGYWAPDDKGRPVWYRYTCPGVYEIAPLGPPSAEDLESGEVEDNEEIGCPGTADEGQDVWYVYVRPGEFRKIIRYSNDPKGKDHDHNGPKTNSTGENFKPIKGGSNENELKKQPNKTKQHPSTSTVEPYARSTRSKTTDSAASITKHPRTTKEINGQGGVTWPTESTDIKGCRPRKPLDIVFVIDSKSDNKISGHHIWNLTRDILSKIDTDDDDHVNVRFIHECGENKHLDLQEFENKDNLIKALESGFKSNPLSSAHLIQKMTDAFSRDDDDKPRDRGVRRRKIGVYVTDGQSGNIEETVAAAQKAKYGQDVELFAVGIGHRVNPTELRAIASCDVDRHYYALNHHSKSNAVSKKISKVLCLGR